ncbi:hypothetical protein MKK63_01975 [Methylobacterium sp. J-088]|uniref:hypothetical protein n=1 Tax=Methylobacterium sp. J-088 TaxID=2836664 RepID=UPI001FBAF730|nr:hypothetical protein [Methylobacterium sp. J-088]MCJ2061481.1 hypothetical protein [Methylobacterium sp. J-088]
MTREDILARKAKRDQIAEQIDTLQQKLAAEDRWLDAVRLIVPAHFLSGIVEASDKEGDGTERSSVWRQAVMEALDAATTGMLPKDIALFIRENGGLEAKDKITRNPNGLYNALNRLHNDAQITKHGDKFYRHSLFEELSAADTIDEDAGFSGLKGSNLFIFNAIRENGELAPRSIIEMLRESDEFGERQSGNPQYGYSAIQRLVRQGVIEKTGLGCYKLVSKENEPSDVPASNGSDAGSDDDGRLKALRLV